MKAFYMGFCPLGEACSKRGRMMRWSYCKEEVVDMVANHLHGSHPQHRSPCWVLTQGCAPTATRGAVSGWTLSLEYSGRKLKIETMARSAGDR